MCDDKPFSISLPSSPTSLHAGGLVDPQLRAPIRNFLSIQCSTKQGRKELLTAAVE
jgi:hypothetical protein